MTHFVLLFILMALKVVYGIDICDTNTTIGSSCVASLIRDIVAVPSDATYSDGLMDRVEGQVDTFLRTCLDAQVQPLRPVNIMVMNQAKGRGAEVLKQLLLNQTGFRSNVTFVDIPYLASTVVADYKAPGGPYLDGFTIDPSTVVDLTMLGALAPLEEFVQEEPGLQWADVLPFFRQVATIYDGHLIAVPFTGQVSVLYYRKDLLAKNNLPVPATWDDLLEAATRLNGTDFNDDGIIDYAICWQMEDECLEIPVLFVQMAAPMLQSRGTTQGWMFDPEDMSLPLNSTAGIYTLDLVRKFQRLIQPGIGCELIHMPFVNGSCAFTIKWAEQFKFTELTSPSLWGKLGVAPLPGSHIVLDRATRTLQPCTNVTCPYAKLETDLAGRQILVNRAPHFGFGGFAGSARKGIDVGYQRAVFNYFANLAGPELSWEYLLSAFSPMGPFRVSHLDPANLQRWTDYGYNEEDVLGFLSAWRSSIENPNVALDIRIYKSFVYREIITNATIQAAFNNTPLADILARLVQAFHTTYEESAKELGDRIRSTYRVALGIAPSVVVTTSQNGSSRRWLPLISLIVVVLVVVLALEIYCRRLSTGRRTLFGAPLAPKSGPDTTLLVAALPDLPDLLRELPEPVVSRALAQYLALMRRLLRKHNGYEGIPHTSLEDVLDMASGNSISISAAAAAVVAGIRGASLTSNVASRYGSLSAAAKATAHGSHLPITSAAATAHQGRGHTVTAAAAAAADTMSTTVWGSSAPLTSEGAVACGERSGESWFMLCVFANPRDALRFAAAAQQGLMRLDWSPLLLQHRKCTPLYALPVQKIPLLSSGLIRAQSRRGARGKQEGTARAADSESADGGATTGTCSGRQTLFDASPRTDAVVEDDSGRRGPVEDASAVNSVEGGDRGGVRPRGQMTVTPLQLTRQPHEVSFITRVLLMRHQLVQLFVPSLSRTVSSTSGEWSFQERMRSCASATRPVARVRSVAQIGNGYENGSSIAGPNASPQPGLAHMSASPMDPRLLPDRRSAIHTAASDSLPITRANTGQRDGDNVADVCRTPMPATKSTTDLSFAAAWTRPIPWVCELPDPLAGTGAGSFTVASSTSRPTSFAFRIRPFSRPATTIGITVSSPDAPYGPSGRLTLGPSSGVSGLSRRSQVTAISSSRMRSTTFAANAAEVDTDTTAAAGATGTSAQPQCQDADGSFQATSKHPRPLVASISSPDVARPAVDMLQVIRMAHYYGTSFKVINLHGELMSYAHTNRLTSCGGGLPRTQQPSTADASLPALPEGENHAEIAVDAAGAALDTASERSRVDVATRSGNPRAAIPAVPQLVQPCKEGQGLLPSPFANPAHQPISGPNDHADGGIYAVPAGDGSSCFDTSAVTNAEAVAATDSVPGPSCRPLAQPAHPHRGLLGDGLWGTSNRALPAINRVSSGLFQCPSMRGPEVSQELVAGHAAKLTTPHHSTAGICGTSGTGTCGGSDDDNDELVPVSNVIFPTADDSAAGTGPGAAGPAVGLRSASGGFSGRFRRCGGSDRGIGWQVVPSGTSLGPASSRGRSLVDGEEEEMERQLQELGVLVQRGLRVCMGLSSGVLPHNVLYSRAARRHQYSGHTLATARALSYAAAGTASRLLLSGTCFKQLGAWWRGDDVPSCTVLNIGEFFLGGPYKLGHPLDLYMALTASQGPCLAAHRRPRGALQSQAGVMEAPLGDVTIVFAKAVGVKALRAWDESEAQAALALFHRIAIRQLAARGGYLVELVEDLCLAAFTHPEQAVRWGLTVLSRLVAADWSSKLLEHELCEEVVISDILPNETLPTTTSIGPQLPQTASTSATAGPSRAHPQSPLPSTTTGTQQDLAPQQLPPQPSSHASPTGSKTQPQQSSGGAGGSGGGDSGGALSTSPGTMRRNSQLGACRSTSGNHITRVLYRGLRLRVGIDVGPLKAEINTVTGRVSYRGRAMNRASRISDKAPAGQVWVSGDVWRLCNVSAVSAHRTSRVPTNGNPPGAASIFGGVTATHTSIYGGQAADPAAPGSARRKSSHPVDDNDPDLPLALAARYQGQHQLKGVQGPMDLWCCRFELPGRSSRSPTMHRSAGTAAAAAAAIVAAAAAAATISGEALAPGALTPPPRGPLSEGGSAAVAPCHRLFKSSTARYLITSHEQPAATSVTPAVRAASGGAAGSRGVKNLEPGAMDTDAQPPPGGTLSADVAPFNLHLPSPTPNQHPANTLSSASTPPSRAASAPRAIASRLRHSTPANACITATFTGVTAADRTTAANAGNNQVPKSSTAHSLGTGESSRAVHLRSSTTSVGTCSVSRDALPLSHISQSASSLGIFPSRPASTSRQAKEAPTPAPMMTWNVMGSTEPGLGDRGSSGDGQGSSEEHLSTATVSTSVDEPAATRADSMEDRFLADAASASGGKHWGRHDGDGDGGGGAGSGVDGDEDVPGIAHCDDRGGCDGLAGGISVADVEGVVLEV